RSAPPGQSRQRRYLRAARGPRRHAKSCARRNPELLRRPGRADGGAIGGRRKADAERRSGTGKDDQEAESAIQRREGRRIKMTPLTAHLLQSTLFAVAAGLLTLAFRGNRAQVRYWLWLSASLKFVVPFALLTSFGSYLETRMPAAHQIATQI